MEESYRNSTVRVPYTETVLQNYTVEEEAVFPYERTMEVCTNKLNGAFISSKFIKDTLPENWPEELKVSDDVEWKELSGWTG